MVKDDDGVASPYPGPEGADTDDELLDEDTELGEEDVDDAAPLPVDEAEEPSRT